MVTIDSDRYVHFNFLTSKDKKQMLNRDKVPKNKKSIGSCPVHKMKCRLTEYHHAFIYFLHMMLEENEVEDDKEGRGVQRSQAVALEAPSRHIQLNRAEDDNEDDAREFIEEIDFEVEKDSS